MLTIKIIWSNGLETVKSVYACDHYSAIYSGKSGMALLLDGAKKLFLDKPSVAYVMSDSGATVDIIRGDDKE